VVVSPYAKRGGKVGEDFKKALMNNGRENIVLQNVRRKRKVHHPRKKSGWMSRKLKESENQNTCTCT